MKKRLIALALCLVMLATCLGAGVDVLSGDLVPDEVPTVTEVPAAEPVPTDAAAEPVPTDAAAEPVPTDTVAEPVPTDTAAEPDSTLYDKLMACETSDEFEAIAEAAGDEQISALTETELAALEAHYAQIQADAEVTKEEYPIPAVNYTNVAPFVQTENAAATEVKALKKSLMKLTRAADTPVAPTPITGESPDGLVLHKTAAVNSDGGYDIKLEAYTTGSVTTVDTTKPTDIIFVLDQSGSMAWNMTSYIYSEAYPGSNHNGTYYVQSNGSYVKVTWCSDCDAWTDGCSDFLFWHSEGEQYSPKASAEDNETGHVQFYSQTDSKTVIRLDALKKAMTNFAASVADKCAGADNQLGTDDDVDHRVAVVGFSSDGYDNTELLTGCSITTGSDNYGTEPSEDSWGNPCYYPTGYAKNGVLYGSITNEDYAKALLSMKGKTGRDGVTAAINALTAHGGTQTLDGLTMAEEILKNSNGKDRNRVVVLFTDGDTNSDRADVVNKAYTLKNTYNATVYTVGIFENANGQPPITDSTTDANALMHRISSNYPNATAEAESSWLGTYYNYNDGELNPNLKDGESYYLSASDADALNNIFQKISQQMSESSIDLGSTVQIKDIVSPYFNMPADTAAVSVKSYDCTGVSNGEPTWSSTGTTLSNAVTIDTATRAVNVTGFDFNHNFVAENGRNENYPTQTGTFHGRKLVITFTVTPTDGFWGGNNVPTNGTDSGVYAADGTKIATFDVPTVNVPLEIPDLTASDKNIYLLGTAPTASDLGTFAVPTGVDAWKTAYVNISPIEADKAISNTEDTKNINLSVTVTPKYTGVGVDIGPVQQAETKTATANVYVFKPELTFQDSAIDLGDTPDYATENFESVVWKHGDENADNVTMTGNAPELSYTYSPAANAQDAFKTDTYVNVTVKIGDTELSKGTDVTFKHQKIDYCNSNNCSFDSNKGQFIVHIKTFDLTITKSITGYESRLYGSQDFVFNVKCAEKNIDIDVVVNVPDGNYEGSVTIKGLPVGTYTITENTGWSWRYNLQGAAAPTGATGKVVYNNDGSSATYTPRGTNNQIIFTNNWVQAKWLSFTDSVKNIFGKPNT